jgi:hypothetical protein
MGIGLEFSRYHAVGHLKMRSSLQFQIISHVPYLVYDYMVQQALILEYQRINPVHL